MRAGTYETEMGRLRLSPAIVPSTSWSWSSSLASSLSSSATCLPGTEDSEDPLSLPA